MVKKFPRLRIILMLVATLLHGMPVLAQQSGSIRGTVYDKDFEAPLAGAQILIAETNQKVNTSDEGNFVFGQVPPGKYTLVFSKDGYVRQVKADVVVTTGKLTEMTIQLSGEFTEMEEFVVQDVQIGTGTEAALLDLRMESPALMDSISSELMSQAGASDAASALKLVAGATVQDGKYAVIRGLPDRYVNSQMNGIRLPTADADKRSVQLDQFPSAIIESIQVSKTFTPDQQGDASGGAVNLVLKGIPNERILKVETGLSYNSQVMGSKFLTYKGGGLNYFGMQDVDAPGSEISTNPIDIRSSDAPMDYKYSITFGDKFQLTDDIKIGGLASFFYERDSSFYDDGIDDKYWLDSKTKDTGQLVPRYSKGGFPINDPTWDSSDPISVSNGPSEGPFVTSLFDVTQASQEVKWGALGVAGLETENNSFSLLHMYTQSTENTVRIAEGTRGKTAYFTNDYSPDDPFHLGNSDSGRDIAPYTISRTLTRTERTTETTQLSGKHKLTFIPDISVGNFIEFLTPELDWKLSLSSASLYQPDKQIFNEMWRAGYYKRSNWKEPVHEQLIGTNVNIGNYFRVWKDITEESNQYAFNWKMPFKQWTGDEGYVKLGVFNESLKRKFDQDSYGNKKSGSIKYPGDITENWPRDYFDESYMTLMSAKIEKLGIDMDYDGKQDISAFYWMADMPITPYFKFIGGQRYEKTKLSITAHPGENVEYIVVRDPYLGFTDSGEIDKANVDFEQLDVLPSIGFVFETHKKITLRGSYTETIARQTFKELSPAQQQEYYGADIFIGNPELKMSALKNYDLRLDFTPYQGGLVSASYFYKDIKNPIEYVQGQSTNVGSFTTPVNYPKGKISGYEFEIRQKLGQFFSSLNGFEIGGNATVINSEVKVAQEDIDIFKRLGYPAPEKRNMMNAPEYLYNLFVTYDIENTGTRLGLFYTVRGDTLVAGAGQNNGHYVPDIYETNYGTLNFSLNQKLGKIWNLKFQAKNLLNPKIETVYRYNTDTIQSSYRKGMEFSISLTAKF